MTALNALTIAEARDGLRRGDFTAADLTEACLAAIDGAGALNAFVHPTPEIALDRARAADTRLAAGEAPAMCGIPLGIKDLFCTEGVPSQAASHILNGFRPEYESTVSARLRNAGAVERDFGRGVDEGVERARAVDRVQAGLRQVHGGQIALTQRVAGRGDGQGVRRAHSTTFGTAKKPSRASGAFFRMRSGIRPSVTVSSRRFSRMGVTDVMGSTPSTSTSFNCSMKPRIRVSSPARVGR